MKEIKVHTFLWAAPLCSSERLPCAGPFLGAGPEAPGTFGRKWWASQQLTELGPKAGHEIQLTRGGVKGHAPVLEMAVAVSGRDTSKEWPWQPLTSSSAAENTADPKLSRRVLPSVSVSVSLGRSQPRGMVFILELNPLARTPSAQGVSPPVWSGVVTDDSILRWAVRTAGLDCWVLKLGPWCQQRKTQSYTRALQSIFRLMTS